MASRKVIIFGPTGAVGSAAARTAGSLGAEVVLAMRDTNKPIPGLGASEESQGNFSRVQADLTNPASVHDAVHKTNAKAAFLYCAHGSPDHMKETIQVLKSSGCEFVVLLSSFTVQGDPEAVEPSEIIPYVHAQVEINLRAVFGEKDAVALRAGAFASNTRQYKGGLSQGDVRIHRPDAHVDCIVPEDIGRVGGTILAKGPQDEQRNIYVYGPKLISQEESVRILTKALGKECHIGPANDEEAYKMYVEERKVPPPLANYMIRVAERASADKNRLWGIPIDPEDLLNVEKYTGRKATTFEEWAEQNKDIFK